MCAPAGWLVAVGEWQKGEKGVLVAKKKNLERNGPGGGGREKERDVSVMGVRV